MKNVIYTLILLMSSQCTIAYAEVNWGKGNRTDAVFVADTMSCAALSNIKIKEFTSGDGLTNIAFLVEPDDSAYINFVSCMISKKYYAKYVTKWVQNKAPYQTANPNELMICLKKIGAKVKKFNFETGDYDADLPKNINLSALTFCMKEYGYLPY